MMTLTLTTEQEAALERSVRSGRFASPEEALSAALSLLSGSSHEEAATTELLHKKYPTLVDLFADSPFKGLDIEFTRDKSTLRDIEL